MKNFPKLVGGIIGKGELSLNSRPQSWIHVEELFHFVFVPGKDHYRVAILHNGHQLLDGLTAEVLATSAFIEIDSLQHLEISR